MGLAGSIEQKALSVQPSSSKLTHDKLNQLLSKVKHIDELGPSEFPEYIAEPQSAKVTGYHVTQDITAPIKEGLLTNRSVGDQNVQGYEPAHVGGAYFWSHPQVAKVQRERFYEMDPSFDEHPHEFPIMKFKMNNQEHKFVPDEDTGVDDWRNSYKMGSFATKKPINMDNLEAIYTGDVEGTKAQIRSAFPSEAKEHKMLQGLYRGYAGKDTEPKSELFVTPQRRVAEYYADKRSEQTAQPAHVDMVLVDPNTGKAYGHSTRGTGAKEPMFTKARKLKPEDVKSATQLYAKGGQVATPSMKMSLLDAIKKHYPEGLSDAVKKINKSTAPKKKTLKIDDMRYALTKGT
jgi:hypothetical protein